MQYLVALDDHRNFQKAAESCAVTQSTLSAGLQDMESIIGTSLIDRTNRKLVRFTPTGDDMLKEARSIIKRMEEVTYRAQAQTKPLSWPLRMGVIPTIAPYLLPKILQPLQEYFPELELHIHEVRSAVLVERVHAGQLDFGIMAFPFDLKGLSEYPMITERFVCAAQTGHFGGRDVLVMDDLRSEKLLLLEDGHCLRDHALAACKFRPTKELETFSASSLPTILQMVAQGYGVTMIPDMVVKNGALPKGVRTIPFRGGSPQREIGIAWNEQGLRNNDITMVAAIIDRLINDKPLPARKKKAA
jgi:LysR family hydrogen peroxide-inducible transcriptional activator